MKGDASSPSPSHPGPGEPEAVAKLQAGLRSESCHQQRIPFGTEPSILEDYQGWGKKHEGLLGWPLLEKIQRHEVPCSYSLEAFNLPTVSFRGNHLAHISSSEFYTHYAFNPYNPSNESGFWSLFQRQTIGDSEKEVTCLTSKRKKWQVLQKTSFSPSFWILKVSRPLVLPWEWRPHGRWEQGSWLGLVFSHFWPEQADPS